MTKNKHASERSKTQNDGRVIPESADLEMNSLWEAISATDKSPASSSSASSDDAWLLDQGEAGEKTSFLNTAAFEEEDSFVRTLTEKVQGLNAVAGLSALSESDQRISGTQKKVSETHIGMRHAKSGAASSAKMPKLPLKSKQPSSGVNGSRGAESKGASANASASRPGVEKKKSPDKPRKTVLEVPVTAIEDVKQGETASQARLTLVELPQMPEDAGVSVPKKTEIEIPVVCDEETRIGLPQQLASDVESMGFSETSIDKVLRTATDIQAMGIGSDSGTSESVASDVASSQNVRQVSGSHTSSQSAKGERAPSSPSESQSKPSISSETNLSVDPVVKHFEGTNEIFVQSKMFDSIQKDAGSAGNASAEKHERSLRSQISLSVTGRGVDNAFGIISSGVLPVVEIDKSFDSPCLELDDENSIEASDGDRASAPEGASGTRGVTFKGGDNSGRITVNPKLAQPQRESKVKSADESAESVVQPESHADVTGEVFVSKIRLSQPQLMSLSKNRGSLVNSEGGAPLVTRKSGYGLPEMNSAIALHPDDSASAMEAEDCIQFAIENLFNAQLTTMLHQDIGDIGLTKDLETLFGYFSEVGSLSNPRVLMLNSDCAFARLRLVRAFLNKCAEGLTGFSCYTTAQSHDTNNYDFVTSLLSSRIGCFPNAPEQTRLDCIVRAGEQILSPSDQRWGCDILYNRFGLVKHILAHKEINNLKARTDPNSLELLLNFITADASRGPVVIAVSEEYSALNHAWRDILRQIQVLKTSNVFIIVMPQIDESPELLGSIVMKCSPLDPGDVRQICEQVLASCQFSPAMLDRIASKCGVTWSRIRWVLGFLRERSLLAPQQDTTRLEMTLDGLLDEDIEIEKAYYLSFPKEHRRFLRFVCLLGNGFYLRDVARVFSLEALPEEVPWFKDKRSEWCMNIASALLRTGELVLLSEDKELGPRYLLADTSCFRRVLLLLDETRVRMLCGAYAHLLERRKAPDHEVAYAYEGAQLWADAARHWLNIARQLGKAFYNRSAYALLKHCLTYISPMHDELYASMMLACIEQAARLGDYGDVCNYAAMLSRVGYLLNDQECSSRAFIHHANALRVQGNFASARDALLNAIQLSEKLQNERLVASAYHALAELVLDAGEKGCLVNALRYSEKSLEIHRRTNDIEHLAETQTLCARIYLMRGEPERAKQSATEAYHALTVSGRWFDTPNPFITLAECATELGEPLPFDNIERGLDIADKTGNIAQQFALIQTRVRLMLNTLQRQAVRDDLDKMALLLAKWPLLPWQTRYYLLIAQFDFSRKNFMKTTKSLKLFFSYATKLGNSYLLSIGYALSAELNFEVYKRELGQISLEKTDKLYNNATAIFESVGAWHKVAETLRLYAAFLDYTKRSDEARNARIRADKVDPYCH